jgi:hypothetical protein
MFPLLSSKDMAALLRILRATESFCSKQITMNSLAVRIQGASSLQFSTSLSTNYFLCPYCTTQTTIMNKQSYGNRKKSSKRKIDSPAYTLNPPALWYTVMLHKTMNLCASGKSEAAQQLKDICQMNKKNHQTLRQQQEDKDKWKKDEAGAAGHWKELSWVCWMSALAILMQH